MRTDMENVRPLGLRCTGGRWGGPALRVSKKRRLILACLLAIMTYAVTPALAQAEYLPAPSLKAKGTTLEWTPAKGAEEATTDWELCTDSFFGCVHTGPQLEQKCEPTCKATLPSVGVTHSYDILAEKPEVSYLAYGYGGGWPSITYPSMLVGLNANKAEELKERQEDVKNVVKAVRVSDENGLDEDGKAVGNEIKAWEELGVKVNLLVNRETAGGVKAIEVPSYTKEVDELLEKYPHLASVEILNEPYETSGYGEHAFDAENEKAYAELVKAVDESLPAGHPPLIAAYGGPGEDNTWGKAVWDKATNGGIVMQDYTNGIVLHAYNKPFSKAPCEGEECDETQVKEAEEATDEPAYVTEFGWSTGEVSEATQSANIKSFVEWAHGTGFVATTYDFSYWDNPGELFGIEKAGEYGKGLGTRKLSYTGLKEVSGL
jgi:hypothetical protein